MGNHQLSLAYQNAAVGRRVEPYRNQVIDETFEKEVIDETFEKEVIDETLGKEADRVGGASSWNQGWGKPHPYSLIEIWSS